MWTYSGSYIPGTSLVIPMESTDRCPRHHIRVNTSPGVSWMKLVQRIRNLTIIWKYQKEYWLAKKKEKKTFVRLEPHCPAFMLWICVCLHYPRFLQIFTPTAMLKNAGRHYNMHCRLLSVQENNRQHSARISTRRLVVCGIGSHCIVLQITATFCIYNIIN